MQRSEKGESNPFYRMYRNKNRKISAETVSVNIFLYFFKSFSKLLLLLLHSLQFRQNQNQHGDKAETSADYV